MRRFPPVPRRTPVVRLFSGIVIAVGLALTTISAQIPGRNINMVAGNQWPDGDPYLQRQNEPSIGASTRNPLHLLAGANDYRTVDLPGLAEDETGDAWLGLFKSYDGGQRWISTLLPGYPQDHSPAGLSSPIHGYGAAADSVVRAGTNGLMYYAGLTFDRSNPATPDVPGKSAIFVARYIDNNNKEAGDPFEYLGTRALQTDPGGATGNFLDKPWMVVDVPRDNTRCTIVTPGEKGPITQSIPAGPVYVAYTLRSTDNKGARYDVMFTRSADCGNTWTAPITLNSNSERANQGASLAVDPRNGNVYIAWRQFDVSANATGTDALMVVKFTLANRKLEVPGFARKFAKPKKGKGKGLDLTHFYKKGGVNKALEAAELSPLDQSTSAAQIRFRTNAYPTMVVDETGRVYLAFAERGYDPLSPDPVLGSARVLMTTSTDGQTWTTARAVSSGEPNQHGHQLMPSLTYAGGKLMLIYYDIRQTRAQAFTKYIDDKTAFQPGVGTGLRHTIDLRASMAAPGANPLFAPSVPVSEYIEGPRVPGGPSTPWQVNPPNLPMFQKGTAPFIGDYVDVTAAPSFVLNAAGRWTYNNVAGSTPPIFHAAWTDNRDVRVPVHDLNGDGNPWNDYTPPSGPGGAPSIFDPTKTVPMCIPGNAGSRNQNVYTARLTGGLLAGSPGNNKRLGYRLDANGNPQTELMQRSFVVFAQNTSDVLKRFRFSITNQPVGGGASFNQFSSVPLTVVEADIPYRSTVSRTVYATSTDPHAIINVSVAELVFANGQWVVKSGGLGTVVVLNPDIDNPDIDNPDIDNPDIDNPDIDNAEVYNPDIDNPDIDNPDIDNPDIDNPDIDNPDIDNVNIANPDIDNPDIDNPDIDNPDIDNPDIDNPDIDNPDIDNASLMTDVSWSITNTGNTTASYNVNLFFAQQTFDPTIKTQLILYRTYKTPVVVNCDLKSQTRNVVVANVPNPHFVKGSTGTVSDPNDPAATNATIYLAPGESAKITLRVFDPSPDPGSVVTVTNKDGSTALISSQFVPNEDVTPVVQQQAVNTTDVEEGVTEPPVVVQFPPPQTVPDSASTSENTPVTFNPLANDSTAFGSTKILSFHPAGMAAHSGGGAGDVVYQPSTGFVYTPRGAVDPATSALVGRFPVPPGGFAINYQQANPRSGINYGRTNAPLATLTALDARPDSATFHQYLTIPNGPALADSVISFTMDTLRNRMYVLHGPQTAGPASPTTVSVIDINPASETFHQVVRSISLPAGLRSQTAAVNTRTNKLYVGVSGVQAGNQPGGVFVIDLNAAVPSALRIPNTNSGAFSLIVNEAANLVFASTPLSSGAQAGIFAIDGGSNAAVLIPLPGAFRFSSHEERFALHEASGKVFYRLESQVAVIDGQRGSPSRNTVLAMVNVGRENGNLDIAVDQELGLAITVGAFDFQADIISVANNALVTSVALNTFAQDVAIDPVRHRAFVGAFTYVQEIELAPIRLGAATPVFIESGGILLNPGKNKGYAGLFNTQAKVEVMSGAGFAGDLAGAITQGRYVYSEWHTNTNRGFMINQGNSGGTGSNPGSVMVVDGASETVLGYVDVLPQPFGLGIDQVANKVYVASLSSPLGHGGVTIVDPTNGGTSQVTFTAAFPGAYPNFPLNNTGALMGFGRFVVPNPVTHKVYALTSGGTIASIGVMDPSGAMKPLDGIAGSPLFTAANPAACGGPSPQPACASWGRVNVIAVLPSLNRVYLGLLDDNNVGRIVALDATTDAVVGSWVGGSHSNRHTASFLAVNETLQRLYVTDYVHNTVTMLNPSTLQPMVTTALAGGPSVTAINKQSNRLYVSSVDSKTIYAIDGSTLQIVSSVRLPLTAYFMWVDPVESRIYTSGGDSGDESGVMVITDVLGQLGTNVSITSVGSALHGTAVLNPLDYSVKYTPNPGYSGPDSFTYSIAAPTGTAIGTISVNVVPSVRTATAFGDSYNAVVNQLLTVAAPGPLGNDATGGSFTTMVVDNTTAHGTLTPTANGAFSYQPDAGFTGVDSFQYHAVTDSLGATNAVSVTITVTSPTSLVVTNTNDSGAGSLRNAIAVANVEPNSVIRFNISGNTSPNGAYVIAPQSALPSLAVPVTIDGYTQPGASPNTSAVGTNAVIKIELRGTSIPGTGLTDGLQINGGGSTIRGLAIGGFRSAGIFLGGATGNNVIEGNFVGTDASGLVAVPNGAITGQTLASGSGITSRSPNNVIGGSNPAARNLVSGNLSQGIRVDSQPNAPSDGTGTSISNNLIGTNVTGLAALPNGLAASNNGVGIQVNVPNVIIGGGAGSRNVISGNNGFGIAGVPSLVSFNPFVVLTKPSNVVIQGNWIGVKADGSGALANTSAGVSMTGENLRLGGATTAGSCTDACNVIAGNGGNGVSLGSSIDNAGHTVPASSAGSIVEGNFIGIGPSGTALPNGGVGLSITAPNVRVGGSTASQRNVISGNVGSGIVFNGQSFTDNTLAVSSAGGVVTGNYIGLNAAGTAAVANGGSGVDIASPDMTIGGITPGERNVVSGNRFFGINTFAARNGLVAYLKPSNVVIRGNYVGTTADGQAAIPNGQTGININGPSTIGGATGVSATACTGACNLVSANIGQGISINVHWDSATGTVFSSGAGTTVQGNYIGLDVTGTAALGNSNGGLATTVPATIGGSTAAERNYVAGNRGNGIVVSGAWSGSNQLLSIATGSVVRGNVIGLRPDGTSMLSNEQFGIYSAAPNVTIGGPAVADGNLIANAWPGGGIMVDRLVNGGVIIDPAGNNLVQNNRVGLIESLNTPTRGGTGVNIGSAGNQVLNNTLVGGGDATASPARFSSAIGFFGGGANNNVVRGNLIGTNAAGTPGLGYSGDGIYMGAGSGNEIGGAAAGDRNIIVSSNGYGLSLNAPEGASISNTRIFNNYIGLLGDGTTRMANNGGVRLFANGGGSVVNTTIGGSDTGVRNLIAGNNGDGVSLNGAGTSNTIVSGNSIGVDVNGAAQPNNHGVWIGNAHHNTIGGNNAPDGNVIAFNRFNGVGIQSGAANRILSNSIYSNTFAGIDLGFDGVDVNDAGDLDSGANNKQNHPVITNIDSSRGSTVVNLDLSTFAVGGYTVQIFANAVCDGTNGEGRRLVGGSLVVQPGGQVTLNELVPLNEVLTATATDSSGNTSEFSKCATPVPAPVITSVEPSTTFASGQMMTINGANFQAAGGGAVIIRSGRSDYPGNFLWYNDGSKLIVRTGLGAPAGPAQLIVLNGTIESAPVDVTISQTPAAPSLHNLFAGSCSGGYNPSNINSAAAGSSITAIGTGIDTSGATFVFTDVTGNQTSVPAAFACAGPAGRVAVSATIPSGLTPSNYSVRLKQAVGPQTSSMGNAIPLFVTAPAANVGGTVRFSATPLSGATVKLVQGSALNPPLQTTTTNSAGFYQFSNVAPGGYIVRVDGLDSTYAAWVGQNIDVAGSNVTQDMQSPKEVTGVSPAFGATGVAAQPTLTWTSIPEATSYAIQINRSSNFQLIESGQSATNSYTVQAPLTSNENYKWQVTAYDSGNRWVGTMTNIFNFTVGPDVVIVGPVGGFGGSEFAPVDCPTGSVVIGLAGRAGDDIDQTQIVCAPKPALAPPSALFVAGGNGGSDYGGALMCGAGEAATGLFGATRNGAQIDYLGVTCTNLDTLTSHNTNTAGLSQAPIPFTLSCPAGKQVIGVQGRQGLLLDQIAIRCK